MHNTNVDDSMIEMITPKIKEIEEKFSRGQGLTQDDINTLLLKNQYNHINHLDMKLNEVTDSVRALEGKFSGLEGKFELLKSDLEGKFTGLEGKFDLLKSDIEATIQKSLNRNMLAMMAMMGFFVVLSKIIDKF
jgi:predicted nuclease with TOPRIM domain